MMTNTTQSENLTVTEAASILRVERKSVLCYINAGHLPAMDIRRPGSRRATYRIQRTDLDAFRERRAVSVPATKPRTRRKSKSANTRQWI